MSSALFRCILTVAILSLGFISVKLTHVVKGEYGIRMTAIISAEFFDIFNILVITTYPRLLQLSLLFQSTRVKILS